MKSYLLIVGLAIHLLFLPPASASQLRPLDLATLSTGASLIIYAEVISNQVRIDDQSSRIVTFTEFNVIEVIKGQTGSTHGIKQPGGYLKERNIKAYIPGVPQFTVGQKYVVFLPEKSRLGFSSPLGLHQGSFTVEVIDGETTVSNGSRLSASAGSLNRSLTLPLALDAQDARRARLDDFINTVRAYNNQ